MCFKSYKMTFLFKMYATEYEIKKQKFLGMIETIDITIFK